MTGFVLIGCTAIAALSIITSVALVTQAWERVCTRRTENWLVAHREGIASQRSTIRDALRNHGQDE